MQLSLERVNHQELFELMQVTFDKGQSMLIRGGTGIGKTTSVEDYAHYKAAKMGRLYLSWVDLPKFEKVRLAHGDSITRMVVERDKETGKAKEVEKQLTLKDVYLLVPFNALTKLPEDIGGIPMPENGFVEWKPPMVFWLLSQPGAAGVLFLDEFLQAEQAVQKPLIDMFLTKQICDMRLQKDVVVVAASNERHDKCGTIELLEHGKNRMAHPILIPPTVKEWVAWARSKDILGQDGEILDSFVDPRIIMLVMSCPDILYQEVGQRKSDAYPTPRSITILGNLIKGIDHEKQKTLFLRLVATRVGNGVAAKFQDVLNHDMATNGPKMLANPQLFRETTWDRRVAFSMWLSGHSRGDRKFLQGACQFLNDLGSHDMLDTMLYMMKSVVGDRFNRELIGTNRYPQARDALVDMAKAVGSLAE